MPTTQDMQTCDIGLTKALLNLGLQNVLPRHKINLLLKEIFWDIE